MIRYSISKRSKDPKKGLDKEEGLKTIKELESQLPEEVLSIVRALLNSGAQSGMITITLNSIIYSFYKTERYA